MPNAQIEAWIDSITPGPPSGSTFMDVPLSSPKHIDKTMTQADHDIRAAITKLKSSAELALDVSFAEKYVQEQLPLRLSAGYVQPLTDAGSSNNKVATPKGTALPVKPTSNKLLGDSGISFELSVPVSSPFISLSDDNDWEAIIAGKNEQRLQKAGTPPFLNTDGRPRPNLSFSGFTLSSRHVGFTGGSPVTCQVESYSTAAKGSGDVPIKWDFKNGKRGSHHPALVISIPNSKPLYPKDQPLKLLNGDPFRLNEDEKLETPSSERLNASSPDVGLVRRNTSVRTPRLLYSPGPQTPDLAQVAFSSPELDSVRRKSISHTPTYLYNPGRGSFPVQLAAVTTSLDSPSFHRIPIPVFPYPHLSTRCRQKDCPVKEGHEEGPYLHNGKLRCREGKLFGSSNPPPEIWELYDQMQYIGIDSVRRSDAQKMWNFTRYHFGETMSDVGQMRSEGVRASVEEANKTDRSSGWYRFRRILRL